MAYIGRTPTPSALTASDITDGIVSNAKLAQDIISADTALGATPADTDEFLVSDAGVLKRMDYSYIKGGISEFDMWRLTTAFADAAAPIASNWERVDTSAANVPFDKIGTGMSESSGIFSFPSTGKYLITFTFSAKNTTSTGERNYNAEIWTTTDNSTYAFVSSGQCNIGYYSSSVNNFQSSSTYLMFDVTDITNDKVRFHVNPAGNTSNVTTLGSTTQNWTYVQFLRLGDT